MRETPIRLGSNAMHGIVTEPEILDPTKPTILLLNAGLIHRVGPNRLNVDIARRLAREGVRSVRFDMTGLGDSPRAKEGRGYQEQAVFDTVEVMDQLSDRTSNGAFVLIGLCTGADNALEVSHVDARVSGCVLIDGHAFPTWRSKVNHQVRRVFQLWRWRRYLKRRLRVNSEDASAVKADAMVFEPVRLAKDAYRTRLDAVLERGAYIKLVFTGFGPQPYNYQNQFFDAFPKMSRHQIEVRFMADANHTFTRADHRAELVEGISGWVASRDELAIEMTSELTRPAADSGQSR